jgi:succinate-acetate transporter protein
MNRATQFVFGSLTVLFVMLAVADATGNGDIKTIAGYIGIICGLSAMYTGMAQVLNEVYGRTLMPLGAKKPAAAKPAAKGIPDKE